MLKLGYINGGYYALAIVYYNVPDNCRQGSYEVNTFCVVVICTKSAGSQICPPEPIHEIIAKTGSDAPSCQILIKRKTGRKKRKQL